MSKNFAGQDYKQIRSQYEGSGSLFTDPEFPPEGKSLCYSKESPGNIEWLRPGEITSDPHLFVDGVSAQDLSQGELGNCWFVAACACIADKQDVLKKVLPDAQKQDWGEGNKYCGMFHFRFNLMGVWTDVVIDDKLPTRYGKLIYAHSPSNNEFWAALLEKAYAKVFGDYESLTAGKARDALVDMVGGVAESIELKDYKEEEKKKELFEALHETMKENAMMSASISASGDQVEAKAENGLIKGHAYSITAVEDIRLGSGLTAFFKNDRVQLVRCRNPWGNSEWTGPWSDNSEEWKQISEDNRKELGIVVADDGEFWMSFDDFTKHFTNMDICHMLNTSFFSVSKTWKEGKCSGEWRKPLLCGGCGNHDSFLENPQYLFDVEKDEDTVLISLMQEDQRKYKEEGKQNETIGFTIVKTDQNRVTRMHDQLERIDSGPFCNSRSVFKRIKLKKGRYMLIPSSFDPGFEGKYLLRMYGGKNLDLREVTEDAPPQGGCCGPKYKCAMHITIVKAMSLEKQDLQGGADPYCIIKVDGQKFKTPICYDTRNPEWNIRYCLFKTTFKSDVVVEVWNYNTIRDEIMGRINVMGATNKQDKEGVQEFSLLGVDDEAKQFKPGKIYMEFKRFTDLNKA